MSKDQEPKDIGIQITEDGEEVSVRELTNEIAVAEREDRDFITLGDLKVELPFNRILGMLREKSSQAFLLTWNGNKIPRGVEINGSPIAWTQNGVVTSIDGEMIGTYDRIEEFGGESSDLQRMVVFPFPNDNPTPNEEEYYPLGY